MFKQGLIKEILKDKTLDKDLVVVANTYQNISNEELIKKLELLNAFVNKKLFRYFQKYPEKRVMFICNIERVRNNTHSHILLRIPKENFRNYYDREQAEEELMDMLQSNRLFKMKDTTLDFIKKLTGQSGNSYTIRVNRKVSIKLY